jgi:hypothetical protein
MGLELPLGPQELSPCDACCPQPEFEPESGLRP